MKLGTIEDLIRYRYTHETMVERVQQTLFKSVHGEFELVAFRDHLHRAVHVALVKGPLLADRPTLVRVHVDNPLYDVFAAKQGKRWPVADALQRIAQSQQGVFVYLTEAHSGTNLLNRIQEYISPVDSGQHAADVREPEDLRTFGIGAQILSQLEFTR